ncbi:hypothetical protein GW866_02965 [bacterium]|nr:hypothetical protein [bacterium]OIO87760.1 MAG: hypothetical protein AUK02_04715 [Anaerolineae bacterium CG2_30_58_95]PIU91697.1 MAG: hypothetical protein COS63_00620 [Anaerolineae bacterium CG06_land_8_20_14_3_00_57_67]PIW20684.1 MAG: hypothetical protein COW33_01420 [Anaerolineae bacterium CG17_big_fil_post_rev_8_21_14_2_50_57_27]PIX47324.1 MAG: hypothetical protein COZ54_01575 [Anaerolineae bacterium CG_4_8_14_3_um_filter_59_70]
MFLINFGHPFTSEHLTRVEDLSGQKIERVIAVPVQFDNRRPFLSQLQELMARVPLSPEQWQTEAILVNLPSLNFIAALLLAELHGRMGYFPSIIRLRPVEGSTSTRYEVAEILNLEAVRAAARQTRF